MENREGRVIPTTGRNNCGGRCLLYAHLREGKIEKMTTRTPADCPGQIPFAACARGLQYHRTFLREDRLRWPMRRVGQRGEGKFVRISWEEAVDEIAAQWARIRDTYGPGSRYVNYATGVSAVFTPSGFAKRLLALDGGYLNSYNSYSSACIDQATRLLYGTAATGSSPETWLESKLILLWGHNPAETRFDSQSMYYLQKARDKGIPIVVVDPRKSDTVKALGARWIPLRPATDAALLDAMAWVIWDAHLADRDFLDRCCQGFDEEHMPPGAGPGKSVLAYLTGQSDGVAKTPRWAEAITGVPAETIRELALAYGRAKPAALIQGYGAQRHAYGEQSARGAILLACMTGNVGVPGGWAAGTGYLARHDQPVLPRPANPYPMAIPVFRWTDAVDHGRQMGPAQGVLGGAHLDADVKMILNLAGNCLINQHSDINATAALLRDTGKCEFILCSDLFMTASARFADILLPGVSALECDNLTLPWHWGDFIGAANKVVEPLYESRWEYDWLAQVAEKLGLGPAFTQGRTYEQWIRAVYDDARRREPELPTLEELRRQGLFVYPDRERHVAFARQRRDPERFPFPTPSGKVELYAPAVETMALEDPFPAIPRYVSPPEGYEDPLRQTWPLQLIGWHTKARCHSIHGNNRELAKLDPQRLWIHPADAGPRQIRTGDPVAVFNGRGRLLATALVTEEILPGVTALAQGAWYDPDGTGTDRGGSINVLTGLRPTPFARGNPQHTNLVQVERIG